MSKGKRYMSLPLILATAAFLGCHDQLPTDPAAPGIHDVSLAAPPDGKGPPDGGESAGNNLSYPVIWAEGVPKLLRGAFGVVTTGGEWWYQWGTNGVDPNVTPASCPPDPDEGDPLLNPGGLQLCDDGVPGAVDLTALAGTPTADNPLPLAKAYVQKDPLNEWQAWSGDAAASGKAEVDGRIYVDWIDWGDNLESVDWYTKSQVRTEVVLFEDFVEPKLEYQMRHTSGWGIDEVHGLATELAGTPMEGAGTRGTVYSACARFTLQKLLVDRGEPELASLIWVPGEGWTEPEGYEDDLINAPLFNGAVYEGGDGPGYYSAEINVKGRVIYGYTWNVRRLNEGAGDYRATFSFDGVCGSTTLNTAFMPDHTQLLLPVEEVVTEDEGGESPGGGAVPVLDTGNNLTYIDIRILERGGGGGGGGGDGGGPPSGRGGGGGGGGGHN